LGERGQQIVEILHAVAIVEFNYSADGLALDNPHMGHCRSAANAVRFKE